MSTTNAPGGAGEAVTLNLADLHRANIARQAEWCPDQVPDLSFRGNELTGETGEACNVIKKLERERQGWAGSRATKEQLAEELADVVICADLCAVTAGIDLSGAVIAKFNATSEKVGLSTRLAALSASPVPGSGSGEDLAGLKAATRQRDMALEALHTLGVRLGVLDGSVACDGPQLLTAMGAYSDSLVSPSAGVGDQYSPTHKGSGYLAEPEPQSVSALTGKYPSCREIYSELQAIAAGNRELAARRMDEFARYARGEWPFGCIKPNSCARNMGCMYALSEEQCRHYGKDLRDDIARASDEHAKREDLKGLSPKGASAVGSADAPSDAPHPDPAQAAPDGYVLVPRRPTPEMLGAFWRTKNTGTTEIGGEYQDSSDVAAYGAMIAARPNSPAQAAPCRPCLDCDDPVPCSRIGCIKGSTQAAPAQGYETRATAAEHALAAERVETARLREALKEISEFPENADANGVPYGVGWAFWRIQGLARSALSRTMGAQDG